MKKKLKFLITQYLKIEKGGFLGPCLFSPAIPQSPYSSLHSIRLSFFNASTSSGTAFANGRVRGLPVP